MSGAISAAEANRNFSTVLRQVRAGRSYVVTSHGRPVARIVPVQAGEPVTRVARAGLFDRLRASRIQTIGAWRREELYEEPHERRG
jgi:prevent-host-death family protein